LEVTNTDLESKTTTQVTADNGGSSTGEPDPLEPLLIEEEQFLFKLTAGTTDTMDTSLSLESTRETHTKR